MHTKQLSQIAILLFALTLFTLPASAHNLWIETSPNAEVGQVQEAYIYLGEYAYGVREDVSTQDHQEMLGEISVFLIKPNGEVEELETTIGTNRFVAEFTPEQQGHYRLALNVTNAPVVDWREYDLGILKTNFFALATVSVGSPGQTELSAEPLAETNELIIQSTKTTSFQRQSPVRFQVMFNGKPLAEQEVNVGYKDQWFKTLYTDEEGRISVSLPWDGQYVIETVYTEDHSGTFEGDDYEAIRHTATLTIPPAE
ncbi:Uncharacterized conserved protein, contains GH25 family domain [Fodinibius roseus]|uniref:Uncharacterized conserved protein, contains GH25 family domain n=1 Tax=Fodinibius roseus TaxID=1194090 RepID=A0A1M4UVR4_9BACT|nr:DUF4198 domain-containing protein [Fodinibius roseus]SHE60778.1 Uncharacterized conserved protein, contains GH25 family domain [Fodinibius roseus]